MEAPAWHWAVGQTREWIWRGWRTRYSFRPAAQAGNRRPLLLLHGFGASIGHWRHNIPAWSDRHPVYALDLLGYGGSQKAIAPYTTELWLEQVYDFWRQFVRQPVILVGNSIGSSLALAVAAAHPEMVQGIAMISLPDSSVLETPEWATQGLKLATTVTQPLVSGLKGLLTFPIVFNPFFALIRTPLMIRLWAKIAYASPAAVTDELVEILSRPAYDRNAINALRAMLYGRSSEPVDYTAKSVLPTLQVPMLLIWGKQDGMVPPTLAPLFPPYNANLKLVELDQAGHCPHDECPDRINPLILNWIASECG